MSHTGAYTGQAVQSTEPTFLSQTSNGNGNGNGYRNGNGNGSGRQRANGNGNGRYPQQRRVVQMSAVDYESQQEGK